MNMKNLFLTLSILLISLNSNAQNDSIAVSQMKELGVYYIENSNLKQISPIRPEGARGSVGFMKVKGSLEYLGENSDNILPGNIELYVFIPTMYKNNINAKLFRLVELTAKKGMRRLKTVSGKLFSSKAGTDNSVMQIKQLDDNCYKMFFNESLEEGHYGVFYNYGGGVPAKLYDFDVVNK